MRSLGFLLLGWVLVLDTGCLLHCDEGVNGVTEGQRFRSTIVQRLPASSSSQGCPSALDLEDGATLDWTAHPGGPGDGCDDELELEPSAISSGSFDGSKTLTGAGLTLASGCKLSWRARVLPRGSEGLEAPMDPAKPSWVLERSFTVSGPVESCFSDAHTQSSCYDEFVIESKCLP